MSKLEQVQKKVQAILTSELGSVNIQADGTITIQYESTMVLIAVRGLNEKNEEIMVEVTGLVTLDTPANLKLYQFLNEQNQKLHFGALYHVSGTNRTMINLRYNLFADYLDPEELLNAVRAVVLVSDVFDDQIVKEFGGKRSIDR